MYQIIIICLPSSMHATHNAHAYHIYDISNHKFLSLIKKKQRKKQSFYNHDNYLFICLSAECVRPSLNIVSWAFVGCSSWTFHSLCSIADRNSRVTAKCRCFSVHRDWVGIVSYIIFGSKIYTICKHKRKLQHSYH